MKRLPLLVLLTALGPAWANPVATNIFYVDTPRSLSQPPDAAALALAGALAGASPGVAASFYNPAALAGLTETEIVGEAKAGQGSGGC